MQLSMQVESLLHEVMNRTAKQRERLEFLRAEVKKPEVLAVPAVAEAYGMEMQTILAYITQESNIAGAKIDDVYEQMDRIAAPCTGTLH